MEDKHVICNEMLAFKSKISTTTQYVKSQKHWKRSTRKSWFKIQAANIQCIERPLRGSARACVPLEIYQNSYFEVIIVIIHN